MAKKRPPIDPRAKRKGKRPDARSTPQVPVISDIDEQFCRLYLGNGLNATDAYRQTHPKASDATARVHGCRVLAKANVQGWLAERLQPRVSDAMTADRVVEQMRPVMLASRMPRDAKGKALLENWPKETLSLIEGWELDVEGRVRKIKLTPMSKGLELAVKYHRLIDEQSRSVNMELDLGSMTDEEIDRRLRAIQEQLRRGEGVEELGVEE
jgi:hypothetical protein